MSTSQKNILMKASWITYGILNIIALWLIGPEVYAFSQPIVDKTIAIVENATTIAKAVIGIGLVWFVFTLLMSRPNFKILICTTFAGVIIAAFHGFVGFFGGTSSA